MITQTIQVTTFVLKLKHPCTEKPWKLRKIQAKAEKALKFYGNIRSVHSVCSVLSFRSFRSVRSFRSFRSFRSVRSFHGFHSLRRMHECIRMNCAVAAFAAFAAWRDSRTILSTPWGIWSGGLGDGLVGTGRVPHFMQGMPEKRVLICDFKNSYHSSFLSLVASLFSCLPVVVVRNEVEAFPNLFVTWFRLVSPEIPGKKDLLMYTIHTMLVFQKSLEHSSLSQYIQCQQNYESKQSKFLMPFFRGCWMLALSWRQVSRTFSKTWGFPSLRLGYLLSTAANVNALTCVRGPYETWQSLGVRYATLQYLASQVSNRLFFWVFGLCLFGTGYSFFVDM